MGALYLAGALLCTFAGTLFLRATIDLFRPRFRRAMKREDGRFLKSGIH